MEKAVHAEPFDVELRKRLADAHRQANDTAAYRREMQRIEVLEPGNKTALAGIYLAFKLEGRQARADEYSGKLRAAGLDPGKLTTAAMESLPVDADTSASVSGTTGTATAMDSALTSPTN